MDFSSCCKPAIIWHGIGAAASRFRQHDAVRRCRSCAARAALAARGAACGVATNGKDSRVLAPPARCHAACVPLFKQRCYETLFSQPDMAANLLPRRMTCAAPCGAIMRMASRKLARALAALATYVAPAARWAVKRWRIVVCATASAAWRTVTSRGRAALCTARAYQ